MKGHWRFSWPRAGVLACGLALSACGGGSSQDPPTWRADCPPPQRPAPLSLEAARAVQRVALRRDGLRLREAAAPGFLLREVRTRLDPQRIAAGELCVSELADLGQLLFDHEYNFADGLGRGDAASAPAGPFHRVHRGLMGGPETISCPSCHWVGGPNGAGAETDNALLQGDGERVPSSDARNPPALIGLGVVEALAREMTHELQAQRANFLRTAGRGSDTHEARLSAKGVDFGVLRLTAKGELDTSGLSGIDADLVVKPFGWKGTLAEFIDFASDAFQVHLGIQSDRLLAGGNRAVVGEGKDPADPDADGVQGELDRGPG